MINENKMKPYEDYSTRNELLAENKMLKQLLKQ
jgi:hypothetical protein